MRKKKNLGQQSLKLKSPYILKYGILLSNDLVSSFLCSVEVSKIRAERFGTKLKREILYILYVLYSTLFHLPTLGFPCVGRYCYRSQDCCDYTALAVRRSNYSANSHPYSAKSHPHSATFHPHSAKSHPHLAKSHPHSAKSHPHSAKSHPHSGKSHPQSAKSHPNSAKSNPKSAKSHQQRIYFYQMRNL
jgi:hypothetical protein